MAESGRSSEVAVTFGRRSDVWRAAPCMVRAFWEFPETVHLLPSETIRRRVLPRYLASDLRDACRFGTMMLAEHNGETVGAAAWLPPGAYPIALYRQIEEALRLAPVALWGLGALGEARRGQSANRQHHADRPPHYWLRAVGVDPSWQRRGVGSELLSPMLGRADAEKRGVFLFTATADNARWYETFGFRVLATYKPTPRWPRTWAMWREAASEP